MANAKKLIKANFYLAAALKFESEVSQFLCNTHSSNEINEFLYSRYGNGSAGQLELVEGNEVVKCRWVLPRVEEEAEALHKASISHARAKDYRLAIEGWIKAVSLNPQDPDYYFNLGIAFFEEKNFKESVENLEYALSICPIYYKARVILGTIYLKLRKFQKAKFHLLDSIYFNPQNALAILNLGAVYSILKEYDNGILAFQETISLVPEEPRAHFGLGKIYAIQGDIELANECFRKVISLDKDGTLAQHARKAMRSETAAYSSLDIDAQPQRDDRHDEKLLESIFSEGYKAYLYGDYARAIQLYSRYLKVKKDDDYVWWALAESCFRLNKIREAIQALLNCVRINKSKGVYHKQLMIAYDLQSQINEAISAGETALKLGKKDSILYTILGKNYLKLNQVEKAVALLDKALGLNKSNLLARYYLALAHFKANDSDPAIDHLYSILNAKIQSPLKIKAEQLLAAHR